MTENLKTTDGGSRDTTDSGGQESTSDKIGLEFQVEAIRDLSKVHHLLVTASYESDERVTGHDLTRVIEQLFAEKKVEPVQVITYTTSLMIAPNPLSLTDAWQGLTDAEREYVHEHMPRLFTALFLAIRGTTPKQKECLETSPHGYPCKVRGEHDVHITEPHEHLGSEVWRTS